MRSGYEIRVIPVTPSSNPLTSRIRIREGFISVTGGGRGEGGNKQKEEEKKLQYVDVGMGCSY